MARHNLPAVWSPERISGRRVGRLYKIQCVDLTRTLGPWNPPPMRAERLGSSLCGPERARSLKKEREKEKVSDALSSPRRRFEPYREGRQTRQKIGSLASHLATFLQETHKNTLHSFSQVSEAQAWTFYAPNIPWVKRDGVFVNPSCGQP